MRTVGLAIAAAIAFTLSSSPVLAQAKTDMGGNAYRKAACDCKKARDQAKCMGAKLGYVASAATAANVYCAAPAAKGKKKA